MGNKAGMKAVPESFACSASSAVNEIEPQRARSTQRELRNSVDMKALIEFFAVSAFPAVNKIKPRRTLRTQRFLAVSASLFYTERDKRRRNDEKIF